MFFFVRSVDAYSNISVIYYKKYFFFFFIWFKFMGPLLLSIRSTNGLRSFSFLFFRNDYHQAIDVMIRYVNRLMIRLWKSAVERNANGQKEKKDVLCILTSDICWCRFVWLNYNQFVPCGWKKKYSVSTNIFFQTDFFFVLFQKMRDIYWSVGRDKPKFCVKY